MRAYRPMLELFRKMRSLDPGHVHRQGIAAGQHVQSMGDVAPNTHVTSKVVERAGGDDAEWHIRPDQVRGYCAHGAVPAGRRKAGCAVGDEIATAGSQVVAWLQDVDANLGQDRHDLRARIRKTMRGHVPGPWIEGEARHGVQPAASSRQPDVGQDTMASYETPALYRPDRPVPPPCPGIAQVRPDRLPRSLKSNIVADDTV